MSAENNKQVAQEFLTCVAAGDAKRVDELMTDDATWWVMPSTAFSGVHSKAAFLGLFPQILSMGEGPLTYSFDEITAGDDRVSVTAKGHLKLKTGKVYTGDYHFLLFFRDGKVARGKEYVDTAHIAEIFGLPTSA